MLQNDLMKLVDIAIAAGRDILDVYDRLDVQTTSKNDGSPVTEADERAEATILASLRDAFGDVPIVAEEEVAAGRVPQTDRSFFLVDPLDGTKEFLQRNGEFTVNIALIEHGTPTAGVVYAPALGELYAGSRDGAWRWNVGPAASMQSEPIRVRPAPSVLTAIGSRSHGSDATADWLKRYAGCSFVSRGSSLKFCHLAAGEADVYPRFGRTMEWDTAAGDAILRAAGGTVLNLDGSALKYNKRRQGHDVDFANPHFIAFGDPELALIGMPKAVVESAG